MDSDKAPYVIVLALSALAWAIGYFYETIVTSPIVEFSVTEEASPSTKDKNTTITIQNITSAKAFPSIIVWIRPSSNDGTKLQIFVGASKFGDMTNIRSETFRASARVSIKDAQPHETYSATIKHPNETDLQISFDSGSEPIRFMQRGPVTFAIQHSQEFMLATLVAIPVFVLLWLLIIGIRSIYRCHVAKGNRQVRTDEGGGP